MKFFAKTDFGKVRQVNQDYYIAENRKVGILPNLFIVADGVGSNSESAFASKHCSDFVLDQLSLSKSGFDYIEEIEKAYRLANTDLFYRIMANPVYKGMGTTMVLASIINDIAIIANVGDSRCYHIRNEIRQVTSDHSMAEELVREHAINRESDEYKELKSQLSRALGASKKVEADFFDVELMKGDYLLMCSDGLSNMVSNDKIYEIVTRDTNIETKVDDLIAEANNNGGRDNIAIILIYIDDVDNSLSVFEKEKIKLSREAAQKLKLEEKDIEPKGIKAILDTRTKEFSDNFRSRSRKRKEESDDAD